MNAEERIISMVGAAFRFFNDRELEEDKFPERWRRVTPQSRLRDAMSALMPGDFVRVVTERRKNAAGLQGAVSKITANDLELPNGSFSTRLVQDKETDEWVLYVKRNQV